MNSKPVNKTALRWRDGRKFARRVHVHSSTQMGTVFHAHPEEALRLLQQGSAEPVVDNSRVISIITLIHTPGEHTRLPGNPNHTTRSYQGQRYVFLERLGPQDAFDGCRTYAFNTGKLE